MSNKEYIKKVLDQRTLWEQLAEESTELAKAALKVIRAMGYSNNSTPISAQEAMDNVKEELQDVMCVCEMLGLDDIESNDEKLERWVKRIEGGKETIRGRVDAIYIANSRHLYQCSNCGEVVIGVPSYCPNCGRYICGERTEEE